LQEEKVDEKYLRKYSLRPDRKFSTYKVTAKFENSTRRIIKENYSQEMEEVL